MSEPMTSTRQACMYCGVYCVPGLSGHVCDETHWMAHTEYLIARAEKAESAEHAAKNKLFNAMFDMEKLTPRIAELETACIHARFYVDGLADDAYEVDNALTAAGYTGVKQ